jgi:hypothetical protein
MAQSNVVAPLLQRSQSVDARTAAAPVWLSSSPMPIQWHNDIVGITLTVALRSFVSEMIWRKYL